MPNVSPNHFSTNHACSNRHHPITNNASSCYLRSDHASTNLARSCYTSTCYPSSDYP
eukprot:CAMPEP_0194053820 /NCGR_PEP_ID=MMETSP0009_2-20130614/51378_1 /TAXON_ID=210454 /ORGANISM="Grammatophora oceanica, Strain CCMP 410" /LENGTH=56 /DNA_ID=CAMNT_0038702087 /DNA_START=21 /DNA_END=187 /DNA_ORIENTATION=-